MFVSWKIDTLSGACGETFVTVEATYHANPFATILHREMVAAPAVGNREKYTLPDLTDVGHGQATCDLVCFWVTVHDELGPIGESRVVAVGPLTARPIPHRLPQDWNEPE